MRESRKKYEDQIVKADNPIYHNCFESIRKALNVSDEYYLEAIGGSVISFLKIKDKEREINSLLICFAYDYNENMTSMSYQQKKQIEIHSSEQISSLHLNYKKLEKELKKENDHLEEEREKNCVMKCNTMFSEDEVENYAVIEFSKVYLIENERKHCNKIVTPIISLFLQKNNFKLTNKSDLDFLFDLIGVKSNKEIHFHVTTTICTFESIDNILKNFMTSNRWLEFVEIENGNLTDYSKDLLFLNFKK